MHRRAFKPRRWWPLTGPADLGTDLTGMVWITQALPDDDGLIQGSTGNDECVTIWQCVIAIADMQCNNSWAISIWVRETNTCDSVLENRLGQDGPDLTLISTCSGRDHCMAWLSAPNGVHSRECWPEPSIMAVTYSNEMFEQIQTHEEYRESAYGFGPVWKSTPEWFDKDICQQRPNDLMNILNSTAAVTKITTPAEAGRTATFIVDSRPAFTLSSFYSVSRRTRSALRRRQPPTHQAKTCCTKPSRKFPLPTFYLWWSAGQ